MIKKLYPGGKEKAFNMTYDDGIVQDIEFIEMLNKYGIKATFNLNSGLMFQEFAWFHDCGMVVKRLSPERAKHLYEGHEIASHTLSHPYMDSLSAEQILHEMVEDRDNLETMFDTKVLGFAVPFDYYSQLIEDCVRIAGFDYARISETSLSYKPCEDYYRWKAGIFHLAPELETFVQGFVDTDEELALCQIVGHSYDLDAVHGWDRMEKLLDLVAAQDNIWFATNIELVRYLQAIRKADVTGEHIDNQSDMDLWYNIDGKVTVVRSGECIDLK